MRLLIINTESEEKHFGPLDELPVLDRKDLGVAECLEQGWS